MHLSPAKERQATLGTANHNLEPTGWTRRAGCGGRHISEGVEGKKLTPVTEARSRK